MSLTKTILCLFFILTSAIIKAQQPLTQKLSNDICACLNKSYNKTEQQYETCFKKAMVKNSSLIKKEYKQSGKEAPYQVGYKKGHEIFDEISVSMIFSCTSYYHLIDTMRYAVLRNLNKDSVRASINQLNKNDSINRNLYFFLRRGMAYFQISDLNLALNDFDSALQLDKTALQAIYFKAWTLELQKKYEESNLLYTQLVTLTGKNFFRVFAAIVQRKKIES